MNFRLLPILIFSCVLWGTSGMQTLVENTTLCTRARNKIAQKDNITYYSCVGNSIPDEHRPIDAVRVNGHVFGIAPDERQAKIFSAKYRKDFLSMTSSQYQEYRIKLDGILKNPSK